MGKPGILEKAKEQVKKILEEHEPMALDSSVDKELLSIIKDVEKREMGSTSNSRH